MKANPSKTQQLTELCELVLESSSSTPIVLIDGRAGAGKSTFAKELQIRYLRKEIHFLE
ncbi:MAG: hypothetical protein ACKOFA_00320 [Rhodoluna sp.]